MDLSEGESDEENVEVIYSLRDGDTQLWDRLHHWHLTWLLFCGQFDFATIFVNNGVIRKSICKEQQCTSDFI